MSARHLASELSMLLDADPSAQLAMPTGTDSCSEPARCRTTQVLHRCSTHTHRVFVLAASLAGNALLPTAVSALAPTSNSKRGGRGEAQTVSQLCDGKPAS
jgi:hypothetical protein